MMRFSLAAGSVVALCGFVACTEDSTTPASSSSGTSGSSSSSSSSSSGSSGSSTSSSSSSSSSSGGTDECAIAPGTYTTKYTTKPGGTGPAGSACTDLPAGELEIKAGSADGGTTKPADGCTQTIDKATCKVTLDCVSTTAGYTTKSKTETTSKGGTVKGTTATKTTKDDDGSVLSDCSYDFEWTKK